MNVRQLVRWLGTDGARAGILQSKDCTVDHLRGIALDLGIDVTGKSKRPELVDEIIRVASKRVDKPLDELFSMSHGELIKYFEEIEVGRQELLDILKELDLNPGREGNRNLRDFAARELSETGRFMRIAADKSIEETSMGSTDKV